MERGLFQPDRDTLDALADRLMEAPSPDPVLLLYLAYALVDAGMGERLRAVVAETKVRGLVPLFDVALLAHRQGEATDELGRAPPGMPLLARGWAAFAMHGLNLPEELVNLSQLLMPAMLTRYKPAAVSLLSQYLLSREVSHA